MPLAACLLRNKCVCSFQFALYTLQKEKKKKTEHTSSYQNVCIHMCECDSFFFSFYICMNPQKAHFILEK